MENSGRLLKNADRDPLTSWDAGCIKEKMKSAQADFIFSER
jgi:hypothetical protein